MRQQISPYGIGYSNAYSQQQPVIKIVSQPSYQTQPMASQSHQQYQQGYSRPIVPVNGSSNVGHQNWESSQHRMHTNQNTQQIPNPLQVVDLQQVEEPWRQKVQELQNRIKQLEQQQSRKEEDEDQESELSQAYSQIQQLVNTIKVLQEEIQSLQDKLEVKQNIIDGYDKQLADKDKEIEDANHYIAELHSQLEESTSNVEEKQKYLFDEVNIWKKKFIEQNKYVVNIIVREFHQKQEELMTLQAELDNLKNAQIIIGKQNDYKPQNK